MPTEVMNTVVLIGVEHISFLNTVLTWLTFANVIAPCPCTNIRISSPPFPLFTERASTAKFIPNFLLWLLNGTCTSSWLA